MNPIKTKRSTQAKLLLILSGVCSVGILPFIFYRIMQNDWIMAVLDFVIVIGMAIIFVYVYITHETKNPSLGFVFIALIGSAVSFYLNGGNVIYWIYPGMLSTFFVVRPKHALLVNAIVLLCYSPKISIIFTLSDIAIILISVAITNLIAYSFAQGLRLQEKQLKKLASVDYLTSTGNRRAMDAKLIEVHDFMQQGNQIASLVILDLDHFKNINDTYGHLKGDEILIKLSKLLKDFFNHKNYSIFRYGGEEFLIICTETSNKQAYTLAKKFRNIVSNNLSVAENKITISLGVAEYVKHESIDEWVHRVDSAMYEAKNQGRDRVIQLKLTS